MWGYRLARLEGGYQNGKGHRLWDARVTKSRNRPEKSKKKGHKTEAQETVKVECEAWDGNPTGQGIWNRDTIRKRIKTKPEGSRTGKKKGSG